MAYGFQQFNKAGDVIVDSSAPTKLLHKLWDQVTITLWPQNVATSSQPAVRYYTLTGVTSPADLLNNYVIVRTDAGGFWSLVGSDDAEHAFTYSSDNTVKVEFATVCRDYWGSNVRTCQVWDAQTQTYDIFSIGKAL